MTAGEPAPVAPQRTALDVCGRRSDRRPYRLERGRLPRLSRRAVGGSLDLASRFGPRHHHRNGFVPGPGPFSGSCGGCFGACSPTAVGLDRHLCLFRAHGPAATGGRHSALEAKRLGQYILEDRIGSGGMGAVYRAHHAMLRRPTAVKLIDPDKTTDATISRFEREVQLTSQLNHPNTIAIYDFGRTAEGVFYYAMELLDGLTLQSLVERYGPQPEQRVVNILRQVCGSLLRSPRGGLDPSRHQTGQHHDQPPRRNLGLRQIARFRPGQRLGRRTPVDPHGGAGLDRHSPLHVPRGDREGLDGRRPQRSVCLGRGRLFSADGHSGLSRERTSSTFACAMSIRRRFFPVPGWAGRFRPTWKRSSCAVLAKSPADRPQSARDLDHQLSQAKVAGTWTEEDGAAWWLSVMGVAQATTAQLPTRSGGETATMSAF